LLNDIFHFIKTSELYNYADDNTLSYSDSYINNLVKTLEMESLELIKSFTEQVTFCIWFTVKGRVNSNLVFADSFEYWHAPSL
jgi:hypothetical protein